MDKLLIEGGVALSGEVAASGAKNSALPVLAACLLTAEPVTHHRIPRVRPPQAARPRDPHRIHCDLGNGKREWKQRRG